MKRLLAMLLFVGCAAPVLASPAATWQREITAPDRKRLARLWDAWTQSLDEVVKAGQGAALKALGPVAVPDAATINGGPGISGAVAGELPVPGEYKCRMVRLGQREGGTKAPVAAMVDAGAMLPCRIEARGDGLWLEQRGGAQRLGGRLYVDGGQLVFLGATALRGEMGVMPYGADPQRDAVGALRAMGKLHWRLELPWPHWQSNLAIVEIVPA